MATTTRRMCSHAESISSAASPNCPTKVCDSAWLAYFQPIAGRLSMWEPTSSSMALAAPSMGASTPRGREAPQAGGRAVQRRNRCAASGGAQLGSAAPASRGLGHCGRRRCGCLMRIGPMYAMLSSTVTFGPPSGKERKPGVDLLALIIQDAHPVECPGCVHAARGISPGSVHDVAVFGRPCRADLPCHAAHQFAPRAEHQALDLGRH